MNEQNTMSSFWLNENIDLAYIKENIIYSSQRDSLNHSPPKVRDFCGGCKTKWAYQMHFH